MSRNEVANWTRRIVKRKREKEARKMWDYLLGLDPSLPRAGSVDIYAVTVSVIPEQRGRELSRRRLYGFSYEWDGQDVESARYEFDGAKDKKSG